MYPSDKKFFDVVPAGGGVTTVALLFYEEHAQHASCTGSKENYWEMPGPTARCRAAGHGSQVSQDAGNEL